MKIVSPFFDSTFDEMEQLPRRFTVSFNSVKVGNNEKTRVSINGMQIGDFIDDNSIENDSYRFHDVFHYTFASMLGWSPCTRAMMKRKRKSNPMVDEIEDGARATITEESISLIIFNKAKQRDFFKENKKISPSLLNLIKEMTSPFEVAVKSKKEWESAILKGYSLFRQLVKNNGGKIHFDMHTQSATYES
ncbi:MAG: nucleotide pyrophosphohydrolase [Flavobacteriales bacterium]